MAKQLDYLKHVSKRLTATCEHITSIDEDDRTKDRLKKLETALSTMAEAIHSYKESKLGHYFKLNGSPVQRMIVDSNERLQQLSSLVSTRDISSRRLRRRLRECDTSLAGLIEDIQRFISESEAANATPEVKKLTTRINNFADLKSALDEQNKPPTTINIVPPNPGEAAMQAALASTDREVVISAVRDVVHMDQVSEMVKHYENHPQKILTKLPVHKDYAYFKADLFVIVDGYLNPSRIKDVKITETYPGYIFHDQLILAVDEELNLYRRVKVGEGREKRLGEPGGKDTIYSDNYSLLVGRVTNALKEHTGRSYVDMGPEDSKTFKARGAKGVQYIWLMDARLLRRMRMRIEYVGFPDISPPSGVTRTGKPTKTATQQKENLRELHQQFEQRVANETRDLQEQIKAKQKQINEFAEHIRKLETFRKSFTAQIEPLKHIVHNMTSRPDQFPHEVALQKQQELDNLQAKLKATEQGNKALPVNNPFYYGLELLESESEKLRNQIKDLKNKIAEERERIRKDMGGA